MSTQYYVRGINLFQRIKTEVGGFTAEGITDNIKKFLADGKMPNNFWKNANSPKSMIIRELKSLQSTHFERVCYDDGWGWGCGICREGACKSKHWEGIELRKWWKFATRWKYTYYYKDIRMWCFKKKCFQMGGYHYLLDDDLY